MFLLYVMMVVVVWVSALWLSELLGIKYAVFVMFVVPIRAFRYHDCV